MPPADEPTTNLATVEDATCTFCGCLCDDIRLTVDIDRDRVVEARNACALAEAWFKNRSHDDHSGCLVEGRPATLDQGLERAASILAEARYPLIMGLAESTSQAQRIAISIADWIGGCVDSSDGASAIAYQEVGEVTCSLGEIKNRGDLIVFWGTDPAESHPRHFERYSVNSAGEFLPRGREDRYCVVVDTSRTKTAEAADEFIPIRPRRDFEAFWILRAMAKGIELEASSIENDTGVSPAIWQGLLDRMRRAKYGAIFYGMNASSPQTAHLDWHALCALVRDVNDHTRFVCMGMRSGGNPTGAEIVLTWRTGYPCAVNLARGYPRYNPGEYNAAESLKRGEPDAVLKVSGGLMPGLTSEALNHLASIPQVALVPNDAPTSEESPTVLFHTATYGIHTSGTVYRMDGVPIPLRPSLSSSLPTSEQILAQIEIRVRDLKGPAHS